jgi:serine/threonine-protein kinase PknG
MELFDEIYSLLPGEAAPRLALGFRAELAGDPTAAAHHYRAVWQTDNNYLSAAFGLARAMLATGDRKGAVATLDSVPPSSNRYLDAQLAAIGVLVRGRTGRNLTATDLNQAIGKAKALNLEGRQAEQCTTQTLEAVLSWLQVERTVRLSQLRQVFGEPKSERDLRTGLEAGYRSLARLSRDRNEKIRLVDRANEVRPRTLI